MVMEVNFAKAKMEDGSDCNLKAIDKQSGALVLEKGGLISFRTAEGKPIWATPSEHKEVIEKILAAEAEVMKKVNETIKTEEKAKQVEKRKEKRKAVKTSKKRK